MSCASCLSSRHSLIPAARQCGRFQFRCTSGECIAVYNVCDGIPQCQDKSDEGHDCPPGEAPLHRPPPLVGGVPGAPLVFSLALRMLIRPFALLEFCLSEKICFTPVWNKPYPVPSISKALISQLVCFSFHGGSAVQPAAPGRGAARHARSVLRWVDFALLIRRLLGCRNAFQLLSEITDNHNHSEGVTSVLPLNQN